MPDRVPIGSILSLRAYFETVAMNENLFAAVQYRAAVMVLILDELIEFREKEGAHVAGS